MNLFADGPYTPPSPLPAPLFEFMCKLVPTTPFHSLLPPPPPFHCMQVSPLSPREGAGDKGGGEMCRVCIVHCTRRVYCTSFRETHQTPPPVVPPPSESCTLAIGGKIREGKLQAGLQCSGFWDSYALLLLR